MLANIVLPLPLPALTYEVPESLRASIEVGSPVCVQLRKKSIPGIVSKLNVPQPESYAASGIKKILSETSELPVLPASFLTFLEWISNYYHYPLGQVLAAALPPHPMPPRKKAYRISSIAAPTEQELHVEWLKRGGNKKALWNLLLENKTLHIIPKELQSALKAMRSKGYVEQIWEPVNELKHETVKSVGTPAPQLSNDQNAALTKINAATELKKNTTFLLEGVTGSGKTEVYIHAALKARREGRNVLILAPEIALTPMLFSRFQSRLGEPIAILHSGLTDRERSDYWHKIARGSIGVVIGARSSILAPIDNLGLIIVDEEHESAFKQDDRLRYNARDLATVLGRRDQATVILGSATPSLESFHNTQINKYTLLQLKNRVTGHKLPTVKIVDQRRHPMHGCISSPLRHEINTTLQAKQQVMLLLNRRGFSSYLICTACGHLPQCPNCSVSLTYYKGKEQLRCHYCGFNDAAKKSCSSCGSPDFSPGVSGTEALEQNIKELFPSARTIRIDRDLITRRNDMENALIKISRGEVDIVVGTQMIAKGHDFPNVTLVGVIDADSILAIPDFRANERAFQLFTQMAGRAGRGDWAGKVIIQTFNPEHPSVHHASTHDFRGFSEEELLQRMRFGYPPYSRIARLLISAPSDRDAAKTSAKILAFIQKMDLTEMEALGPAPSMISKIQNRYRWNILLKSKHTDKIHRVISAITEVKKQLIPPSSMLQIDVDPSTLM